MKPSPLLPLLLSLLLLAPLASAAEPEEDTAWSMEARDLDVLGNAAGFTFTSRRDTALGVDTLSGGFDATRAELTTALRVDQPGPAALRMSVAWSRIAEYRDVDGDGLYGLADETLQSIPIAGLPQQTTITPALGGSQVATVVYTLPANESEPDPILDELPARSGTLSLGFTLVPTTATVAGSLLRPTEVGLRAEVRDFQYQAGDTRLALVADVATESAALDAEEGGLTAVAGRHSWLASWVPRATADGGEVVAGWSSLASDAGKATAVLSLPRGESVSQEGSVSTHRLREEFVEALRDLPPGDWRFYAIGLAGAAVALGIPSLRRLRER